MEFFNEVPSGYKKGKTKFVVVTGSVMSGVGKGTFNSALTSLLMFYKLKVSLIKFDGYLNVDAGTLNPYRHGEVFVLEDGTETDLDLGTYERALHRNLSKDNYLTSGKIFKMIIEKERRGEYLGRDVQFIPHVTGEIKNFIRKLAMKDQPDILIIEVGGTVGDIENSYFIEAMRELRYEEGKENVIFVNCTYIIQNSEGEQKSKAAQLGVSKLMSLGILPDIVVCRAKYPVQDSVKEKISMVSNIPIKNVISFHDLESIYYLPLYFRQEKLEKIIFNLLKINPIPEKSFYEKWTKFASGLKHQKREIEIAITGKYTSVKDSYISILKAIEHCSALLKTKINIKWLETTDINNLEQAKKSLQGVSGIIVPGGFGERGVEGKILCIKYARENNIPFLGLCYGMQLATIEFARSICNLKDANTTEICQTNNPVIDILPEQKTIENKGGTMRLGARDILIKPNTLALKIYKKNIIKERFRHRYEVNPEYISSLEKEGLVFSGISKDDKRIMQILELKNNKFFLATQFHPELTSKPLSPNPVFLEFIKSCL